MDIDEILDMDTDDIRRSHLKVRIFELPSGRGGVERVFVFTFYELLHVFSILGTAIGVQKASARYKCKYILYCEIYGLLKMPKNMTA